jgi:PAS domain S-box-containing protein
VASAIKASDQGELLDIATLLVSEVVTNSVIHSGTEIELKCQTRRAGLRVEVSDRSTLSPSVRHYDTEAMTGRGLALVSMLSASWGVHVDGPSKTVWFELGQSEPCDEASSPELSTEPRAGTAAALEIRLRGASPRLVKAAIEHGDALLRELALLALGGELDDALPEGWQLPQFDVLPILAAAEAATAQTNADLELRLPAGAAAAATERLLLVDHADALAREGRLLTAPALPEVAVCRHWLYTQIAEQAAGFAPRVWELPKPLEPALVAARLPTEELQRLEGTTTATLVADDANRIIFVNQAAGELLGWEAAALMGQRLTVLIPPEQREAHLAGFSRLQVTGKPQILGSVLRVPALRRDGSTVQIALFIEQLAGPDGRSAFRAALTPAADDSRDRPVAP